MRVMLCLFVLSVTIMVSLPVSSQVRKAETPVVASQKLKSDSITISATGNKITVTNASVGSKLEIYSVVGLKVSQFEIKQSPEDFIVDIAKGYYIIRVEETVRKVAIR